MNSIDEQLKRLLAEDEEKKIVRRIQIKLKRKLAITRKKGKWKECVVREGGLISKDELYREAD